MNTKATTLAGGLVVVLCSGPVAAQAVRGPGAPEELESWAGLLMARHQEEYHIPGAVLVVVKDGRVFLANGYGQASREQRRPVDPERTAFRVASITKLFTATAAMQLVDRGKLSLEADVNTYLTRFKLPATHPTSVTLFHLLTHTGGFDERAIGRKARRAVEMEPLGAYLARRMPPRVMNPGEFISYSNHGMALAGHLVEEATGLTFGRYMEENVFLPLGMSRSSLGPPRDTADLAVGYRYEGNAYNPVAYDYVRTVPASMLTTTGTDMARFMVAHLKDGGDGDILSEAAARAMHRRQFTQHPSLPGVALGFWERFQNGERALWHDGDMSGFASLLYLLPERGVGLFVAYNSRGGNSARQKLLTAFLDRYYPDPDPNPNPNPPPEPVRASTDSARFAGSYVFNRRVRRGLEKLASQGNTLTIRSLPEGALVLDGDRFLPAGALLFRREDGKGHLAFKEDEQGRITHMFAGSAIARVYERRRWHEAPGLHLAAVALCAAAFLSACLASFRDRFRPRQPGPAAQPWAWTLVTLLSALNLAFLVGLVILLAGFPEELEYRVPPVLMGLLAIPLLTTALTVPLLASYRRAWRWPSWHRGRRLHYTAVTLAALAWILLLDYWNLLGLRY